jgi:hypothetical protein
MTMSPRDTREAAYGEPSRRAVLAAGVALTALGLPVAQAIAGTDSFVRAEAALFAILRHRDAAAELGHAALASWPHMGERALMCASILGDLGFDHDSVLLAGAVEIGRRLSQQIRQDFAIGRTVMLEGWVLSLTETRLYVLAALARD